MSVVDETPEQETPAVGLSLRDRVQARERELERSSVNAILVPVPGLEDFLAVRYRPLSFQEMVKLEKRHERLVEEKPAEGFVRVAADKLIHAEPHIMEMNGDGKWHDTEYTLDARAARDLFGRDLGENATRRDAVRAIFRDDEGLIEHAAKYEELRRVARSGVDGSLEGE